MWNTVNGKRLYEFLEMASIVQLATTFERRPTAQRRRRWTIGTIDAIPELYNGFP